jgi:hypothetical protein
MIKTAAEALELLRQHDMVGLYDTLDTWQQRELLCIVRRMANELARECNRSDYVPFHAPGGPC